jgi:hypothetical protein
LYLWCDRRYNGTRLSLGTLTRACVMMIMMMMTMMTMITRMKMMMMMMMIDRLTAR